ncbi:SNAP25 ous protein, variant 2 [Dionaea muscipula]
MFGFMKSPFKSSTGDSDTESDNKSTINTSRRTSSEPILVTPDLDEDNNHRGRRTTTTTTTTASSPAEARNRYKNDFRDAGGLENQSVQELENYAVYKAEETTKTVNNCLSIAEDIREDASRTLDMLHQQGEQITRTHQMAVNIDQDLSKGEKLLNSLGGMFSMPWKPKKTRHITGPIITPDDSSSKSATKEQKEKLVAPPIIPKGKEAGKTSPPEQTNPMQKVELEKAKQDDALSDLSNILGDLKGMAIDMGSELDRQNKALDHLGDDIDELNSRMKGANQRARKLTGK